MLLGEAALADAVTITGPEAIFLFGGLAKAGKYLFEPTKKYMEMHMLPDFRNKGQLVRHPRQERGRARRIGSRLAKSDRQADVTAAGILHEKAIRNGARRFLWLFLYPRDS